MSELKINHHTLNTGNVRISTISDINPSIYFILNNYISQAKKEITELIDETYFQIIEDENGYVCTLYTKMNEKYIPILSTLGTKYEWARKDIWTTAENLYSSAFDKNTTFTIPSNVPYIVDIILPTCMYAPQVFQWTGDFTKCIGWMMLFPEEIKKKL